MTSAHEPLEHPAATPLLRWISNLMCLSTLCSRANAGARARVVDLRDDCPDIDELLAWRELVEACAARGR